MCLKGKEAETKRDAEKNLPGSSSLPSGYHIQGWARWKLGTWNFFKASHMVWGPKHSGHLQLLPRHISMELNQRWSHRTWTSICKGCFCVTVLAPKIESCHHQNFLNDIISDKMKDLLWALENHSGTCTWSEHTSQLQFRSVGAFMKS